jgi:hypothetical protein
MSCDGDNRTDENAVTAGFFGETVRKVKITGGKSVKAK